MLGKETESCVTYIEKFRFTKSMVVFIAYVIASLGMGHFRSGKVLWEKSATKRDAIEEDK